MRLNPHSILVSLCLMVIIAGVIVLFDNRIGNSILTRTYTSKPIIMLAQALSHTPQTATVAFVGDVMLGRGIESSVFKNGNGDFQYLFNHMNLASYDIAFGNLEGPVSDRGLRMGSKYSFRFATVTVPILAEAGFDIMSVANNHAGDYGAEAFTDTLAYLGQSGIEYTGGGFNSADATLVRIIRVRGIRFGFVGFSDVGPNWMLAGKDSPGILRATSQQVKETVQKVAPLVDHLIVSFHFGDEYETHSNVRQRVLAHIAIDTGAHLVIGHHPHVRQEIEYYKNGLIAYSLGNFIFDQSFSGETMHGVLLEVTLDAKSIRSVHERTVTLTETFQPTLP